MVGTFSDTNSRVLSARSAVWCVSLAVNCNGLDCERKKEPMIGVAIIVAEILFWVFLLGGLFLRYGLGWKKIGIFLLVLTPVVDLVLIALTYSDLSSGQDSSFFHGLSAFYVGFSIIFGHDVITAMDKKFQHRFHNNGFDDGGEEIHSGAGNYQEQLKLWKKSWIACAVSLILLGIGIAIVGLAGAFWLIYWAIALLSIPLLWWFIGPVRARKEASKS